MYTSKYTLLGKLANAYMHAVESGCVRMHMPYISLHVHSYWIPIWRCVGVQIFQTLSTHRKQTIKIHVNTYIFIYWGEFCKHCLLIENRKQMCTHKHIHPHTRTLSTHVHRRWADHGPFPVSAYVLKALRAVRIIAPQICVRTIPGSGNPNSRSNSYVTSVLLGSFATAANM